MCGQTFFERRRPSKHGAVCLGSAVRRREGTRRGEKQGRRQGARAHGGVRDGLTFTVRRESVGTVAL